MRTKPQDLYKLEEQILELKSKGLSITDISKVICKDRATVLYHLKKMETITSEKVLCICNWCKQMFERPVRRSFCCDEHRELFRLKHAEKHEEFYEENGERFKTPKSYAEILAAAKKREPEEYKYRGLPRHRFDKIKKEE